MPKVVVGLIFLIAIVGLPLEAQTSTQKKPTSPPAASTAPAKTAPKTTPAPSPPARDWTSDISFGLSANLDLVHINLSTRQYVLGFTPGLAFGVKYGPPWWTMSDSFIGLDALLGASFINLDAEPDLEYFQINAIPVLSLASYLSLGLGVSYNLALKKEAKDTLELIFTFGLSSPVSMGSFE